MLAEPPTRLFTVEEYECMIAAGILYSGERVELFEGRILAKATLDGPQIAAVVRCNRSLARPLPPTVDVWAQMPIRLPPDSEPEPDIAVVRHRDDDYASGHPGPSDILLVIEVAGNSFTFDRDRKLPRYAAAGIPDAWLVDLPGDRIWRYRSPQEGRYTEVTSVGRGETLAPLALPDLVLAVDDLLPPVSASRL